MLFGHEKGALLVLYSQIRFAKSRWQGHGLLDEISEMPIALQAKLLRVIQEKGYANW